MAEPFKLPAINPYADPQPLYGDGGSRTYIVAEWVEDGSLPLQDGVYQTQSRHNTVLEYSWFSAEAGKFGVSATTAKAATRKDYKTDFRNQDKIWRGITSYVEDGVTYHCPVPPPKKKWTWSDSAKERQSAAAVKAWETRRQNQTAKAVLKRDKAFADAKAALLLFLP